MRWAKGGLLCLKDVVGLGVSLAMLPVVLSGLVLCPLWVWAMMCPFRGLLSPGASWLRDLSLWRLNLAHILPEAWAMKEVLLAESGIAWLVLLGGVLWGGCLSLLLASFCSLFRADTAKEN